MVELKEFLKNPSPELKVPVYTENKDEDEPVKKPRQERMTLTKLAEKMDAGFKQINTRLDYIVKANDLKDLPRNK